MSPWWNLPFAVLALLALWCRVAASQRAVDAVAGLLAFFGVDDESPRQAAADFFGIAGVSGLLFVGWGDELAGLAAIQDAWLLVDAVLTALGLGLLGAWLLARLDPGDGAELQPQRISREMTMIEVDDLPQRPGRDPV
jgi:hypothetical protein